MDVFYSYRDLRIWQESVRLIKAIYALAELLPKSEEYNLKQQLKRAIVSVALNIAEGKNRRTSKDFAGFLTTAAASLAEVDAILVICQELGYLTVTDDIQADIHRVGKMITLHKKS